MVLPGDGHVLRSPLFTSLSGAYRNLLRHLHFLRGGVRIMLQERQAGHHHSRRAIATLEAMLLVETFLQGMQFAILLQAFNGHELAAMRLHSEHGAGFGSFAVNEDGAGAATGRITANVGAGQMQDITQPVYEEQACFDVAFVNGAIDGGADMMRAHINSLLWRE